MTLKKCYEFILNKGDLYKDWKTTFCSQIRGEEKEFHASLSYRLYSTPQVSG